MTDSTDERIDDSGESARRSADTSQVPADADWELVAQSPFETADHHDLTTTIISAVAEAEDVSPRDIKDPPLYEVLDVAALEASFFGSETVGKRSNNYRSVEFMYRDFRVVVRSDAWVLVYEAIGE